MGEQQIEEEEKKEEEKKEEGALGILERLSGVGGKTPDSGIRRMEEVKTPSDLSRTPGNFRKK